MMQREGAWLRACASIGLAALVVLGPGAVPPCAARDVAVDVELVLAVDISHSMDEDEQRLQRQGYVEAFRHPEVLTTIRAGRYGRIAVAYVEWAGLGRRFVTVPWTLIGDRQAAEQFAGLLEAAPILAASRTSISGGLLFAAEQFAANGFEGLRRVIDISGDGPNNMGPRVDRTRDQIVAQGIVINGLPLMLRPSFMAGFADQSELNDYYRDCVIGGFGSFLVTVEKTSEIVDAIRRKLILELSGLPASEASLIRAQAERRPRVDCLLGEKIFDSDRN